MINLLPAPQEIATTGDDFKLPAKLIGLVSPWKGDDAAADVLLPALGRAGCSAALTDRALPGPATLVLAKDPATAEQLADAAAKHLSKAVPTRIVYTDGPCMPSETTLQRRVPAPPKRDRSKEAYYLVVEKRGIAICGRSRRGLFWGIQTLRRLLDFAEGGCIKGVEIRDWPNQDIRGVHVDMKYMFQRASAMEDFVRGLSELKLNAALFEYEDKFPYEKYPFLRGKSAMTPAELKRLLTTARRHHVDIIPLIQSLGHLEYALKHEELAHLREAPDIHTQACPSNPDVLRFVTDIIDEVMDAHPDVPVFHIGGDETGFLGHCPKCKAFVEKRDDVSLYLKHQVKVLRHVIDRGKRPILWDDIVRTKSDRVGRIPRETILCYWDYGPRREEHGPRKIAPALEKFYRTKGRRPEEWADTLSIFPFFDFYRQKGFDVIAAPCLNYGTLVPSYEASGRNTMRFIEKSIACGGIGSLNTQWACFQIPFGANWYGYALTAECAWLQAPVDTGDFDMRFSRGTLGMADTRLVAANQMAAEGVGFRMPFGRRPYNLLHYAIMDAEIHFDGGMDERQRIGSAMGHIDFVKVARRKLEMMKDPEAHAQIDARADWVAAQMTDALALLKDTRPRTARGRLARDLLTVSAQFKLTRLHTLRLLMGDPGGHKDVAAALRAEKRSMAGLRKQYARSLHRVDLDFQMRLLFSGEIAALEKRAGR